MYFFLKVKLVYIYRIGLLLLLVLIVNLSLIGGKICVIFVRRIIGVFVGRYIMINCNLLDKWEESCFVNCC